MGWGNNNGGAMSALPSFSTYAEAKRHYDNTKEIRGSNNIRPLGLRRAGHSMRIVSSQTTTQKYIAAKLYQTECVRWMEPVEGGEQVLTIGVISGTPALRQTSLTGFCQGAYGLRGRR
jgi:hypothetical protein